MKLPKLIHLLASIALVTPIAVVSWMLSRPLPEIGAPRVPIDDRKSRDPERDFLIASTYWDEKILSRFKEESLFHAPTGDSETTYRFILLPSFDKPVCVRVQNRDGKQRITVKVLSGVGGYGEKEYGSLMPVKVRDLNAGEWNELQRLIDDSSFWFTRRVDPNDDPVNDGATWVLEGATDSYHLIDRITPSPELEKVMIYMLELGGMKKEYEGYYLATDNER